MSRVLHADGWTDMTKLISAFHRNFAKTAINQNVKVDNINLIPSTRKGKGRVVESIG
jgi:hypothetical protein